ncbi:MAG: hypothetical protein ACRDLR_05325 [Gaiellaceae bacterium]
MPPVVRVLRATQAALDKLGARTISDDEAEQIPRNRHVVVENLRGDRDRRQPPERRLLIGRTDGGRALTLVIEETLDPESWLIITGWEATVAERRMLGDRP